MFYSPLTTSQNRLFTPGMPDVNNLFWLVVYSANDCKMHQTKCFEIKVYDVQPSDHTAQHLFLPSSRPSLLQNKNVCNIDKFTKHIRN